MVINVGNLQYHPLYLNFMVNFIVKQVLYALLKNSYALQSINFHISMRCNFK